ncbi:MAG: hypothetical protein E6J55_10475 [Deltaproteobacteria bacterium]|nr:MAG: hypothetical protein E6J55_10475 [Deltaproteobacteria bacterium]
MANVLIIGLDGATWRVLEPWARAGRLPHLAGLMARGSWGTLRSTVPALTLPAWSSLTTGRNPGAHGVFAFRRLAPDRYDSPGLASTSDLRAPTLWEIAGRAGRRAGIINVPPSYPIRPLNGFVVSCLLTPPGECFTHPPELASELGGYRIDLQPPRGVALDEAVNREQALAYLQGLRRLTSGRTAAALHLMRTRPTDVLGVVFYAPDRIQHCFWTYVDGGVAPDTEVATAVAGVYAALDQGLGDLTEAAGPEATVILVSDHGFGPKPSHAVHVNRWLADAGFLRQRPLWTLRRKVIRKVLPRSWRSRLDVIDHILVHRPRSRAWADTLEPGTAAVWIHVAGRYPYGCVGPGAEYEAVRTEIVTGLQALRGPEGEPVFQAVHRREELYHGRYVGEAPDVTAVCAPRFGVVYHSLRRDLGQRALFSAFREEGFSGAHDAMGIYLFAGPQVRPHGRHCEYPIESIAPTALHLLGLAIPRGMDAPACTSLLDPDFLRRAPLRFTDDGPDPTASSPGWRSREDEAVVAARLQALGYLE